MAKKAAKKVTKKVAKTAAKKPAPTRDPAKPLNQTQIIASMAQACGLEKKQVKAMMDYLPQLMQAELKKPGIFQIPGLIKIQKVKVPKQPAIKNWKNPFTGEIMTKPAKPASTKIKLRPLKKLKDMA